MTEKFANGGLVRGISAAHATMIVQASEYIITPSTRDSNNSTLDHMNKA